MSRVLALDLGTRTGWALGAADERLESGVQVFEVRRGESPGMRYVHFRRWLDDMLAGVRLVAFEMPHLRGGAAATLLAGLQTRVEEACAALGIEHVGVHSATLKKWAAGKGNADKAAMVAAVRRRWLPSVTDDNEADAVALLNYTLGQIVATPTLSVFGT